MAIKSLVVSDISSTELTDETHARVVVEHPDMSFPIELDISTEEAEKFQNTALRLVTVTVYTPGAAARTAVIETKTLDKLFGANVNFDAVLAGGRKAQRSAPVETATRKARGTAAPKGDKVDYTAPDKFGQLHRGRITEEEASLVRSNKEQASQNREAQTGSPINWTDAKEVKRYGLS